MRLIYIAGVIRSGSTLLERVLTSSCSICAVGEFNWLWRVPTSSLACSCGKSTKSCDFWSRIIATAGIDDQWLDRMRQLERRVAHHPFIARKRFDLAALARDPEVREFIDRRLEVLAEVAHVSGSTIIVDSSKAPQDAWLLAAHTEPLILHLSRDSRDWIASVRTPKFDQGLGEFQMKTGFYEAVESWARANLSLNLLGRRAPVYDISYEKFADAPRQYLEDSVLGSTIKPALDSIAWTGPASVTPSPDYHSLMGNPDRYARSEIKISRRSALTKLSGTERLGSLVVGNLLNGVGRIL